MRIAVPLAIPVALGLIVGVFIAISSGNPNKIAESAAAAGATPSASASATAAPAPAAANVSCDLIVPANALTAQGLATPWQLTGPNGTSPQASGCNMANAANLGAFVQATIVNPTTGNLRVYNPLVITQGTTAAAAPAAPTLAAGDVVNITFGFNGTNLTLINTAGTNSVADAQCNQGLQGSIFGQVGFCNSPAFYAAANQAEAAGALTVPALGTTIMGQPCPTTRSFELIDQDQSDNVTSTYLLNGNGQTAQDTAANAAAMAGSTPINNGSDNLLLDAFVDPAVGCTPFEAPDITGGGATSTTMTTSQSLNELQSAADQQAPIALVPMNDPMTLVTCCQMSATKTNDYRVGVDQPAVSAAQTDDTPANYCANMLNVESKFIVDERANLINKTSPVPATGNNLFTFMAARLSASFTNLNCQNFGLMNTVSLTLDGNGVAIAANVQVKTQTPTNPNGNAANANSAKQRNMANLPATTKNGGNVTRENPGEKGMGPGNSKG